MGTLMLGAAILIVLAKNIFFKDDSDQTKRKFLIFTGVLLVAIFATRNAVLNYGSDLNNYYRLYIQAIHADSFGQFSSTNTMEKGYLLMNWLLSRIIKWPQFILLFQAAFCIGITLRFIYKYTNDVLLSALGFMSFGLMQFYLTGFRQSFAIALCLVALELAVESKLLGFLAVLILAFFMHQTAIVFLPVYWLVKIRVSKLSALLDAVLILLLSQSVPRLIFFGNEVFDRSYEGGFGGNRLGGIINIAVGAMVIFVLAYQSNKYQRRMVNFQHRTCAVMGPSYVTGLFHLLVLGIGIYALRYQALVLERISLYFTPCLFVLLPYAIDVGFTKESRKFLRIIFLFGMLFLTWWRLHNFSYEVFW